MHTPRAGLVVVVMLAAAAIVPELSASLAAPIAQTDSNVVVQITSPRAGERVRGTIEIDGYAADRRAADGSGLNERDIQVYLNDANDPRNLLGYAGAGRPSPEAASVLGPQFNRVGFERVWDTCTVAPGAYELVVWASSLVVPGARNFTSTDIVVDSCPAAADAPPAGGATSPGGPAAGGPPAGPAGPPAAGGPPPAGAPAAGGAPPGSGGPAGASAPGAVLLQDNFADPSSGFQRESTDPTNWRVGYEGGEYFVIKQANSTGPLAIAGRDGRGWFGDFAAEIDARMVPPIEGAYLFITFRGQDVSNWYSLAVDPSNRTYGVFRAVRGQITPLVNAIPSQAVNPGTATNRLGVRAQGADIVAYVNGQEVYRTTDATYTAGYLTLGVGSATGGRAEARFSNLIVTSPN